MSEIWCRPLARWVSSACRIRRALNGVELAGRRRVVGEPILVLWAETMSGPLIAADTSTRHACAAVTMTTLSSAMPAATCARRRCWRTPCSCRPARPSRRRQCRAQWPRRIARPSRRRRQSSRAVPAFLHKRMRSRGCVQRPDQDRWPRGGAMSGGWRKQCKARGMPPRSCQKRCGKGYATSRGQGERLAPIRLLRRAEESHRDLPRWLIEVAYLHPVIRRAENRIGWEATRGPKQESCKSRVWHASVVPPLLPSPGMGPTRCGTVCHIAKVPRIPRGRAETIAASCAVSAAVIKRSVAAPGAQTHNVRLPLSSHLRRPTT